MRSVPVQSRAAAPTATLFRPTRPHSRSLFCAGAACNFISSPFQSRTPAPASGVAGFLSEICTVRLAFSTPPAPPPPPSFPSKLSSTPLVSANGLSRGSGYGNGWRRWSLRVSGSFCFCSVFHQGNRQCIFYNAAMSRWPGVVRRPLSPTILAARHSGNPR